MDVTDNMNEQQSAILLAGGTELGALLEIAASLRNEGHRNLITYSKKVFIPLTHSCQDSGVAAGRFPHTRALPRREGIRASR